MHRKSSASTEADDIAIGIALIVDQFPAYRLEDIAGLSLRQFTFLLKLATFKAQRFGLSAIMMSLGTGKEQQKAETISNLASMGLAMASRHKDGR